MKITIYFTNIIILLYISLYVIYNEIYRIKI